MKLKTVGRMFGAIQTSASVYFGKQAYDNLASIDYSKAADTILGDYPIEYKLAVGLVVAVPAMFIPGAALMAADGLTDMVKGTHHYMGTKIIKALTRNEQKKQKIDKDIKEQLEIIEHDISRSPGIDL